MRRPLVALSCVFLTFGLVFAALPSAQAVPLPATYGGSSGGDVANVGVSVVGGLQLAGVRLANADSQVDSTATERSSATSRNLGATVAGLGVAVAQNRQVAPPDNPTDPATPTQALAQVSALGIGATGLASSDRARWTGDASCFAGDLANSFVSTDSVSVAPLGLAGILTTGAASTRGTTGLVTTSGLNKAVRSEATGNVANVNLLGTAVQVAITGASTLGVTADGSTTSAVADYRPGTISYTVGNSTRPLALGDDVSFDVGTVATGRNTIALRVNRPTTTGTGRSARSSVAGVVSVTVTTRLAVTQAVTGVVSVDLLPLTVAAQAPAGGIDCTPDAPTVTTPANGSRTNDATPTYSGTGRPGASINLTLDGGAALNGVATVDGSQAWSYTPTVDLADGTHRVSVTQTVGGATSSASGTNVFTVDATAPAAPRVTTPAAGALLSGSRPTYAGTAESSSTVNVFVDGSSVGTVTADGAGSFSLPSPAAVADGTHTVYATATDASGNTSASSATNSFRVDATAPAAPVVVAPASASTIRDTTPRIAGTAEAGSSVTVFVDSVRLATSVTASGTGAWETTSGTLGEGLHAIRAQASDVAGNLSPFSDAVTFSIDRTAPAAPVIVAPADGSRSADATPTLSGTGEVDATVTVAIDGVTVGTPAVNGSGRWTLALSTALPDGPHVVTARQSDAAGNVSAGTSNGFTVDTTAPAAPVITGPVPGSVLRGPSVTISGTGEPGATLTVTDDLGGALAPVTVGASGTWTAQDTGLADGTHTVTAVQADAVGNVSGRSNAVGFRVAANAAAAPVITVPANGSVTNLATVAIAGRGVAGDQVVITDGTARVYPTAQVTTSGTWSVDVALPEGTYTVSATQDDGAGASASSASVTFTVDRTNPAVPVISAPADRSLVRDTTPRLGGTGEPGASVAVTVDTRSVGTAQVGGDGTWTLPLTTALAQGAHTVAAVQTDAAGNASAGSTSTFTVDTVAPGAPVITAPTEGSALRVATPTVRGTGTAGDTVELSIDGGSPQTATVATNGTWSITPATALPEGAHTASAVAVDPAGNRSAAADVGFTVDLTAPAAPVVQRPADGTSTRDTTPTLSGLAEAGGTVLVSLNGSLVGTTVATSGGTWSLVTPTALTEGAYTVYAVVRDAAGNVSTSSATTTFTVDVTAPAAPAITAPANGALITDRTPAVSGTGETGNRVTVTVDGQALGTVTVNGGTWTIPVTAPLSQGQHALRATQADAAGNVSTPASSTVRVDSVAPDAPTITAPSQSSVVTGPDVTVTGRGEAGARLVLTVDGVDRDPVTVTSGGSWSVVLTGLDSGPTTVSAVQTDTAGNSSVRSADRVFTIGGTAPAAPVVTAPGADALVSDTTPTIAGTGIDGAVVTARVDGDVVGTSTVTGGTWSVTPGAALGQGAHVATASQTVGAAASAESGPVRFTVDSVAPAKPLLTAPADGTVTGDRTPTVSGTGEPGAVVTVFVDGVQLATATVGQGGTWALPTGTTLAPGSHELTGWQTDPAGNTSGTSNPVSITVDTSAPAAPVITAPADRSSVRDTTPRVGGSGEPGALVAVAVDGRSVGSVRVGGDGTWGLLLTTALDEGSHTVTAVQTDAASNTSVGASSTFTVDTTPPAVPVITAPADRSAIRVATPTVRGTGTAGDTIEVSVDDGPPQPTTVLADGTWSVAVTSPLAEGSHVAAVVAVDKAGNRSAAVDVSFTVDLTAPAVPVVLGPVNGTSTRDTTPTLSGTAEAGASVRVVLNGAAVGTVGASSAGSWSLVSPTALAEGSYVVSATATDAAGNTSGTSATTTFIVDLTPPPAPTITAPANAALITDRTPTIGGAGETGDRVTVTVDGQPLGTATVNAGAWSVPVTEPLGQGDHVVGATQADAAGNLSASVSSTFRMDSVAPAAPTITAPSQDATVAGPAVTVAGTGEAGARLVLTVDGLAADPVTVASDGSWSVSLTGVADGQKSASAVQTDVAGNASTRSAARTFTVGETAPAAPVITTPAQNALVNDTTPPVEGTGIDGATVTVRVDGAVVGTATVADGAWSVTPARPLEQGAHVATAAQTVGAVDSAESGPVRFTVDSVAPSAPSITAPVDGTMTNDATPIISGTGEPSAVVTVFDDGQRLGAATVGQSGSWALPAGTALTPGRHALTARQTDPAGNASGTFDAVAVTIDTMAPAAPVIVTPTQDALVPDPTLTVTGTGEAGARLTLQVDGTDRPTVTVRTDGAWSVDLTGLSTGEHTATAIQTDRAGNTSSRTDDRRFAVGPAAPSITTPGQGSTVTGPDVTVIGAGVAGASLVLTVDGSVRPAVVVGQDGRWSVPLTGLADGSHTATAVQTVEGRASQPTSSREFTTTSDPATPAPRITTPLNGSRTTDRTPPVSGTGVAGATVTVLVDGADLGSVVVVADGTWSLTPTTPLGTGSHTAVATQRPPGGAASPQSTGTTFTVLPVPAAPVITSPVPGATSDDLTPTISGTGASGATVTVSVDDTPAGPAVAVGTDAAWSVTLATQTEGTHVITATQTDAEGTTSPRSAPVRLFVRSVSLPAITSPRSGAVLTVLRPTVSGTGEADASITVTVLAGPASGDALGTTMVTPGGTWSLVVDQDLAPGSYRLGATQRVSGTPDRTSNEVSIQVVGTPDAPSSLTVRPGDRQLGLSFTAPPAAGGKSITGYQVSLDGGRGWSTLTTKAGTPTTATVAPVLNGSTYAVSVRAVNGNGAGRATATATVKVPVWFADPVSKADRAKEVAVPKDPSAYKGKLVRTTATNRSRNGTTAYPAANLKGRQLQPQQAVELDGALFGFDSATLTANGKKAIASMVPSLRYVTAVTCEGFADYGGSSKNETALAKSRSTAVCAELKKAAKQVKSVATAGYGSSYPTIIGGKPADRAANRRTVILIRS